MRKSNLRSYLFPFTIFIFLINSAQARDISTKKLEKTGKLNIPAKDCVETESKLGQLLYVNVDNFGAGRKSGEATDQAYIDMVKDLQIGGVLPHTTSRNPLEMRKAYNTIKGATTLPVMIGVDYHAFDSSKVFAKFGMGYGRGYLDKAGELGTKCLADHAFLEAFLHRAIGLNHALGPTIENHYGPTFLAKDANIVAPKAGAAINELTQLGVAATMKHYPYTPQEFDLHYKTADTKILPARVKEKLEIFGKAADSVPFAMSTHLYNSQIDPDDMATFSKKWVDILRNDLKFDGILMTDGLFMFSRYDASMKQMSAKWPQDQIPISDSYTIFAARSILSGHDMAFLEGTADATYRVFDNLLSIACSGKPVGNELRERVNESYARIARWKKSNEENLRSTPNIPETLIDEAAVLQKELEKPYDKNTAICSENFSKRVQSLREAAAQFNFNPLTPRANSDKRVDK